MTRHKRWAWFAMGCLGMLLLSTVLYALLQGAHNSQSAAQTTQAIRETQVNNRTLLTTIQDCTQPTGKCFRDGQKRTGAAVASINRVVILAASCAVGQHGTVLQIKANILKCVVANLGQGDSP